MASIVVLGGVSSKTILDLPDEILLNVFLKLDGFSIGASSRVCPHWNALAKEHRLWKRVCKITWNVCEPLLPQFGNDWKNMFVDRPRLRFDGVYVARASYVRPGQTEGNYCQPVHLVTYHRYLRFYNGRVVLATLSAEKPSEVVKFLRINDKHVHHGEYTLDGDRIVTSVRQVKGGNVITDMSLRLWSSRRGLNNRLAVDLLCARSADPNAPVREPTVIPTNNLKYRFYRIRDYMADPDAVPVLDARLSWKMDKSCEPY